MKWFGPDNRTHEAPEDMETVPAPTEATCEWCSEEIAPEDTGFLVPGYTTDNAPWLIAYHRDCFLRTIYGSVEHQLGMCSCARQHPSDALINVVKSMTKRAEARAAVRLGQTMMDMMARKV